MIRHPIDLIESMQEKPESVRRAIAFSLVAVIAAIILSVWLTTFSLPSSNFVADASVTDSQSDQPSPIVLLWNLIKESVGSFKNSMK